MTLGQFSTAVGAAPRWIQNALAVLGLPPRYTVAGARRLALARTLGETCDIPLGTAYPIARQALAQWPARRTWEHVGGDGVVRIVVDLERFLSSFAVRLSLAQVHYGERKRGRPARIRRRGLAAARAYGIDIGLLHASLERAPAERLRRLDDALAFFASARVAE